MPVLQQYYTSFVNPENGRAGFQVKAMSPGISSEAQDSISRMLVYRVPSDLDERAIATHPIALRYYYQNDQECILLCSQSCGSDENGRPGNFFAHSLVMSPQSLVYQPPILYWHSPFWRKSAPEINTLAPLPITSMQPSTTIIEQMWTFLAQPARRDAFKKLLCAVIHAKTTSRRIIIQDRAEHVALWITAVSCMLPPLYRPFLSFSTYHHDPAQSWFLITGINDPSVSTFSPDKGGAYFILDGPSSRTSEVQPSSYADLIASLCTPQDYQNIVLQHFLDSEKRFPAPTALDESLDMLAISINLRTQTQPLPLKSSWLPTISTVLASFEQMPPNEYDDDDKAELKHWVELLVTERETSNDPSVHSLYERARALSLNQKFPFDATLAGDLKYHTKMLLQTQISSTTAAASLQSLHDTYGDAALIENINRPDYVKFLLTTVRGATPGQMQLIWTSLGPYLQPHPHYQELLVRSLYLWNKLIEQQSSDAARLPKALQQGIAKNELAWFLLLPSSLSLPPTAVKTFYWECVQHLPLEARAAYREKAMPLVPDLKKHELHLDLSQHNVQQQVQHLQDWLAYGPQALSLPPNSIIDSALQYLQKQNFHWQELAAELLLNQEIAPALGPWHATLVRDLFATLSFQNFVPAHMPLYQAYKTYTDLSDSQYAILAGMASFPTRQLDTNSIRQIHIYINSLKNTHAYYEEVYAFLAHFLQTDISAEQHQQMVSALFIDKYANSFWLAYWGHINPMLNRLQTHEVECVLRLFSYWFVLSPTQFRLDDQSYVVQGFFFTLPTHLRNVQSLLDTNRAFENVLSKAASYTWSPILQDLLTVRKKNLVEKSQEWMRSMQQRLPHQKTDEPEQKLSADIEWLLQKDSVADRHIEKLLPIYQAQNYDLFWTMYRERLALILRANDPEHVLEIFSFWFDKAFHFLHQDPFVAQAFMTRLFPALETFSKELEGPMHKIGHTLIATYQKGKGRHYCWYPLVHPFFYTEGKK